MTHSRTRLRRQTRIAERIAGAVIGLAITALLIGWIAVEAMAVMGQKEAWR